MARIRTIKPDFFTSEDIVALSPFARLLYVALWCEADREGRMSWRPATFKLRYFPGDKVGIDALCGELTGRGLVVLYGDALAYIPKFLEHQHINAREAHSCLPVPDPCARVSDTSARVRDVHGGRKEGKEREDASRHGARLPPDWLPSEILKAWAVKERPDLDLANVVEKFRDYWTAKPGRAGVKLDWGATFRNWVRDEKPGRKTQQQAGEVI